MDFWKTDSFYYVILLGEGLTDSPAGRPWEEAPALCVW